MDEVHMETLKEKNPDLSRTSISVDATLEPNSDSSGYEVAKVEKTDEACREKVPQDSSKAAGGASKDKRNFFIQFLLIFKPNLKVLWQRLIVVGLLLLTVQLSFAGLSVISVLFVKNVELDVWLLILCRCLIAATFSIPLALAFEGRYSLYNYNKSTIAFFFIMGLVFSAVNPILYQVCVKLTTGSFASVMQQLVPIYSFIFCIVLKVETTPSFKDISFIVKFIGLILCVSSAVAISALNFTVTTEITWQNWLAGTFVALVTYSGLSLYLVFQAKVIFTHPNHPLCKKPFTANSLASIYGTILYVPICGLYMLLSKADLSIRPGGEIAILYAGFGVSVIGYTLMVVSIRLSSPMISSCLFSLQVVTSMIMLRFLANESMTTVQYIISIGVIGGALMVVLSPLLKKPPKEAPRK